MKVRFFNTFDTVTPLFRTLLPHLALRGHRVELLLARHKYRSDGIDAVDADYRIRQVPTLGLPRRGGRLHKLSITASYGLSAAALSLPSRWPDVNVFLTQPPLFAAWGGVLRALHRQPYCMVGMDLYPWVAVEAGVLSRHGILRRAAETVALASLRGAQRVVVIGRCMAERVATFGVAEERINIIPNWADTSAIRPVPPSANRFREELGLGGRFVVMYSGNLGVSHYFDDLLEVAHRLRSIREIVFVFIGKGARLPEVRRGVMERGLGEVRFLGYQDYDRLSESLSLGDVHFITLRDGFEGLVVPSKTYGALAAGRPIIYQGSERGEIARMIEESRVGMVVEQGRVDDLESAVLRAYHQPSWREGAGERARRLAEERYSVGSGVRAYAEVLEACHS